VKNADTNTGGARRDRRRCFRRSTVSPVVWPEAMAVRAEKRRRVCTKARKSRKPSRSDAESVAARSAFALSHRGDGWSGLGTLRIYNPSSIRHIWLLEGLGAK